MDHPDDAGDADLEYLEEFDASRGIPFQTHLLAGSGAGLAEHCLVFPLDTIKTNAQCVGQCGRTQAPDVVCVRAAKELLKDGYSSGAGALRLWRGVGAVTIACVPAHAMYFGSFELVRSVDAGRPEPSVVVNAVAGAVAAVGHDAIMTPADVVKQRLQLGHYGGLVDCFRETTRFGGLASLYRSLPTTLAMNVPYGCASVALNEHLKSSLKRRREGRPLGVAPLLACGGAAGAVASLLTTPLDVVKTRLQTQNLRRAAPCPPAGGAPGRRGLASFAAGAPGSLYAAEATGAATVYNGFADAARAIYTADGYRGFFRGATMRALAQAPSVAIVWTTYELLIRSLAPPAP